MKKVFTELKNYELLSREQLKHIGGSESIAMAGVYSCKCFNNPGSWVGWYDSDSQADSAISTYCDHNGGYCLAY
ncbi:hypothetical protein [uncultured Aquimarina sp.]|uniref:hypothetical protein n=1 Tax=uncultured Aquimarina sp. TaxID=575652 RepID=UPI002610A89E|nr:hypothetical protein [uncultured Aquimarina sp.]